VELNASSLRERSGSALAIAHASIVFPFVLGSALSLYLYPRLSTAAVPFTVFSLFLGVSMSVTAFPVLARILTDRSLQRSPLGEMALTCAAFADATAWCLLAFVVGVANSQIEAAGYTTLFTLLYLLAMVWLARPAIQKWVNAFESGGVSEQSLMVGASIGLLLSCLITERIGIHALFGAFLFGALIRHDSRAAQALHSKLYDFVVVMLLPAFFAMTGLRTQIWSVEGAHWLTCGLIIVVAFTGKFGGSTIAARISGQSWRDSAALGILMNTRGLMELIVLNVGLDLGVISPRLFAMLVIMALVTTFATAPILDLISHRSWREC
jgi:Kef-type K+ transport system membrane component KefB